MSPPQPLLQLLLLLLLATALPHFCISATAGGDPLIWPLPQYVDRGSTALLLSPSFAITSSQLSVDVTALIARYTPLLFPHSGRAASTASAPSLSSLHIALPSSPRSSAPLDLATDESYNLSIPLTGAASLSARTFYGALRGLETFSQLVTFDFAASTYVIADAPWSVRDWPRFPHRGLLLDVSRHFHPLPALRRMVDAMSYAKLNVLHLHLTDTQAFPFHSPSLPLLSLGAYSPIERYSLPDIADLVQYSRQRGVRIMIELDMPGHAASWCVGYPELCPSPTCQQPLDPSNERTFTVIEQLLTELTAVAPYSLLHVGGDEVDAQCWTDTPHVSQWMAARNYTVHDAIRYFTARVHAIAHALQRTPVTWDEVFQEFTTDLDPTTIVHVWRLTQLLINATNLGYRSLVSVDIPYYLDNTYTWTMQYATDPWDGITAPEKRALVLGGETCMWSEGVDSGDLFNTVWPRAAAIAEKFWSAWEVDDVIAAEPRFAWFRCLLNNRGIAAAPTLNTFRQAPPGPGACLSQ